MRQTAILLSILLFYATSSKLYAQDWSEWVSLSNTAGVDASVSFKIKNNCGNFGYSFYRTNNSTYSQNGSLTFSYKYYDCNSAQSTGIGTILLAKTGIDQQEGYWFLTRGGEITDIRIDELYLPERKIWLKRVNGEVIDFWKRKYGR